MKSMNLYHKKNRRTKQAFTLVELSLAVAFMSLLLIIMTTLILSLIAIYRKGVTVNAVNFVGRSIIEDFQNAVSESEKSQSPESICVESYPDRLSSEYVDCVNDGAMKFVYDEVYNGGKPKYGAFCTGSYSYIWNTGDAINKGGGVVFNTTISDFRLLKVYDTTRTICKQFVGANYSSLTPTNLSVPGVDAIELIAENETQLAIYHLYISKPATTKGSKRAFFSGSFILATLTGGINIMSGGNYCKPPGSSGGLAATDQANFNYCAINKFNFAVQGNGG